MIEPSLKDDPKWHSATFTLENKYLEKHGRVIYSHFSASGAPMQPVTPGFSVAYVIERVQDSFSRGLWSRMSDPEDRTAYQVQLYVVASREITDEQLLALRKLHMATRDVLNQHFSGNHVAQTDSSAD